MVLQFLVIAPISFCSVHLPTTHITLANIFLSFQKQDFSPWEFVRIVNNIPISRCKRQWAKIAPILWWFWLQLLAVLRVFSRASQYCGRCALLVILHWGFRNDFDVVLEAVMTETRKSCAWKIPHIDYFLTLISRKKKWKNWENDRIHNGSKKKMCENAIVSDFLG